ncbi:MAG: EamA/RhaT family transporter [Deltaproteobacteria bacterium]|nr:MAG: EamA/RhaT family transporter [Deltaproteobacteria bacterium]
MDQASRGSLLVLASAVGFAFKGIVAKLVYAQGMEPVEVVTLRMILAAPLFWLGLRAIAGSAPPPRTREDWTSLALGAGFALAALADFESVDRLGAGPSRVILFTFPLFVLLFQAMLDRRAPAPRELVAFGIAWGGLLLVAAPGGVVPDPIGIAAGLLASTSYAVYLLGSQSLMKSLGSARFTTLTNTGALTTTLLASPFLIGGEVHMPTPTALGWMALLVVFATVLPFFALFEGIREIGAPRAGLLALIGPPITVGGAWLFLGEQLTIGQLAGSLLVVGAVGGLRWVESREAPE